MGKQSFISNMLEKHIDSTDMYIFSYGSLLWNREFSAEAALGRLQGYSRRFCVTSISSRGNPKHPGVVLGLVNGGYCDGFVITVKRSDFEHCLDEIWSRELIDGDYLPIFLPVEVQNHSYNCLVMIPNKKAKSFTKRSLEEAANIIRTAGGKNGSNYEYFKETHKFLTKHLIHDEHMSQLNILLQ